MAIPFSKPIYESDSKSRRGSIASSTLVNNQSQISFADLNRSSQLMIQRLEEMRDLLEGVMFLESGTVASPAQQQQQSQYQEELNANESLSGDEGIHLILQPFTPSKFKEEEDIAEQLEQPNELMQSTEEVVAKTVGHETSPDVQSPNDLGDIGTVPGAVCRAMANNESLKNEARALPDLIANMSEVSRRQADLKKLTPSKMASSLPTPANKIPLDLVNIEYREPGAIGGCRMRAVADAAENQDGPVAKFMTVQDHASHALPDLVTSNYRCSPRRYKSPMKIDLSQSFGKSQDKRSTSKRRPSSVQLQQPLNREDITGPPSFSSKSRRSLFQTEDGDPNLRISACCKGFRPLSLAANVDQTSAPNTDINRRYNVHNWRRIGRDLSAIAGSASNSDVFGRPAGTHVGRLGGRLLRAVEHRQDTRLALADRNLGLAWPRGSEANMPLGGTAVAKIIICIALKHIKELLIV